MPLIASKFLRDRFQQASLIGATKITNELGEEFKQVMDRIDDARGASLAILERHYQ